MSKAELVIEIALKPGHKYGSLWSSMNEKGVVSLLCDMIYLRAGGYVNGTGSHPDNVYTILAGISPDAHRLFARDDNMFIKEIFGRDLDKDFGVTNISVYETS